MALALLRNNRLIAAAIFVGLLSLYLLTLTQVHTFDALSYITSVERKPWTELFHPHHLAYGPFGSLALTLSRALGYDGGRAANATGECCGGRAGSGALLPGSAQRNRA